MTQQIQSRTFSLSSIRSDINCVITVLVYLLLVSGIASAAQSEQGTSGLQSPMKNTTEIVRTLTLGQLVEQELRGGETHIYQVKLDARQFIRVVVEQRGIDVVVRLVDVDGKPIIEMDSPNGTQGPEAVSLVAEASGAYQVEVRSLEKGASVGRYEVRVSELRAATGLDRSRVSAEKAYAEGERLRAERTSASRRKAIKYYEEALQLMRSVSDRQGEALTLTNIGTIYNLLGEPQKALEYLNQALPIAQGISDHQIEAATLTNIGMVHYALGEPQKALDSYHRALPIVRAAGDRSGEAGMLTNIGTVYRLLGEPQKALDHFAQALPLRRIVGDRRGEATTLNNIGTVYRLLGEPQKALNYFDQVLPIVRAISERRVEAATLTNIGTIYNLLGEPQKALEYLNQALPIAQAIGDRQIEAATLTSIGIAYSSSGESQKGLDYLNRALPLRRTVGDRQGEATTLNHIGRVYHLSGEPRKALDYYNQALPIWQAIGDRNGEVAALYGRARAEYALGYLMQASTHTEAALAIVNSLRTKVTSQDLRTSYFASVQDLYKLHIDVLMQLHNQRPTAGFDAAALTANEQARARSLLDTLVEASADIRQGVNPNLLERRRSLQHLLNMDAERLIRLLSSKHTEEDARAMKRKIDDLLTQLLAVEAEIKAHSPRYAALTQPVPLTLSEIQMQVVDSGTLLLEYSLGEERSYLWAVTPTAKSSYELPPRAVIEAAARRCYELLTARNRYIKFETVEEKRARVQQADAEYSQAATALSRMLLAPVAAQLGTKRLLVVSDGALEYVPFAALPIPEGVAPKTLPNERQPSAQQVTRPFIPVIAEHEVVSIPSASTLAVLRRELQERALAAKTVAVFADPVFDQADERVSGKRARHISEAPRSTLISQVVDAITTSAEDVVRSARQTGTGEAAPSLPRLPFTRREAQAILAPIPSVDRKEALDFEANRAAVLNEDLGQYRIVHFATHTFLNSVHPELSGIVLSMVDRQGRPQDGFLRAHEVFNLRLKAELVVLSGCRTGLGKEVKGEGLLGLTRGFMYAGARRVLVSLWDVQDEATAELMTRFYREMLGPKRLPATAALRAAQIEIGRERRWRAPYYWASFVLQGEPR